MTKDGFSSFSLLPKIIDGGIAGAIGVTCVFPLDLVKTRLQNQQIGPNGERMYKNMFDCFKKTYAVEGFSGMYRGSAVTILLITPEKSIKLTVNDFFRHQFKEDDGHITIPYQVLSGALAGICQTAITTPMELLKINMQDAGRVAAEAKAAGKDIPKISASQLTFNILRERGFFGLYKGFRPTIMRDVSFSIFYFPLFAELNALGPRRNDGSGEAVFWSSLLAGLTAGAISAWAVTPLDVIKTRLQANKISEGNYKGVTDVIIKTMKHEGPTAFFKGGLCRIIVLAPLFGIAQCIYHIGIGEKLLGYKN